MVYYQDGDTVIRTLEARDAEPLTQGERAQGWHVSDDKFTARLRDMAAGLCEPLAAEYRGRAVGHVNVYKNAPCGALAHQGYPEIVDFAVLEAYRRLGLGSRLMDAAEAIAARQSDTAVIGVGLHAGYGAAQRMYVKRGYVPDGTGAWYGDKRCEAYRPYALDDELAIFFTKKVR